MQNFNQNPALMYLRPLPFWEGLWRRSQPFLVAVGLHACVLGLVLLLHYSYGEPSMEMITQTNTGSLFVEIVMETETIDEKPEPIIKPQEIENHIEVERAPPLPRAEEEEQAFIAQPQPTLKEKPRLKERRPPIKPVISRTETTRQSIVRVNTESLKKKGAALVIKPKKKPGFTTPVYPAYLRNPTPAYPKKARRRKQEGVVLLFVEVNEKGQPLHVRIKKSSGVSSLDKSALSTVKKWRFLPARKNNIAVVAPVIVPIRFQLRKS